MTAPEPPDEDAQDTDGPVHELEASENKKESTLRGYQVMDARCGCGEWRTPPIDARLIEAGYADHLLTAQLVDEQHAEHEEQVRLPLAEFGEHRRLLVGPARGSAAAR